MGSKYIVFNRDNWNEWAHGKARLEEIEDAVVIRRQDIFAPPAFDAYAASMRIALEGMDPADVRRDNLQRIADYFSEEAAEAWLTNRKLPD